MIGSCIKINPFTSRVQALYVAYLKSQQIYNRQIRIILESKTKLINMRCLFLLGMLACLKQAVSIQIDPKYSFEDFCRQHGKNYSDWEQEHHRLIYQRNYGLLVQRLKVGDDFQINEFLDWNQTQWKAFSTYIADEDTFAVNQEISSKELPRVSSTTVQAPSELDWRKLGGVGDVKDQRKCGACWAIVPIMLVEAEHFRNTGKKINLSAQHLLECEDVKSLGCKGGNPLQALRLMDRAGAPLESEFPYKAQDDYYTSKKAPICASEHTYKLPKKITGITRHRDLRANQIQHLLFQKGPLIVGVHSNHLGFYSPTTRGGVMCPTSGKIDHVVLLVGYNRTHWIIQNTWGLKWGDKGFGYVSKYNDCGLSTTVYVVQFDNSPAVKLIPAQTDAGLVQLTISMRSPDNRGFRGTALALRQEKNNIVIFGLSFLSGQTFVEKVRIPKGIITEVVVVQLSQKTEQLEFIVSNSTHRILSRVAGTPFVESTVIGSFCPSETCPSPPATVVYFFEIFDQYGDGLQGTELGLRQNTTIQTFGKNFTAGRRSGQMRVELLVGVRTDIIWYKPGDNTQEIGFVVWDDQNQAVASRQPGSPFAANQLLGSFCPGCLNQSLLASRPGEPVLSAPAPQAQSLEQPRAGLLALENKIKQSQLKALVLLFATCILGASLLVSVGFLIYSKKLQQNQKSAFQ